MNDVSGDHRVGLDTTLCPSAMGISSGLIYPVDPNCSILVQNCPITDSLRRVSERTNTMPQRCYPKYPDKFILLVLVECPCVATGCYSLYIFLVGLILLLIYLWHDILPLNDEAPCFGAFQDKLRTAQHSPLYVAL
jgi:hypothetical protein